MNNYPQHLGMLLGTAMLIAQPLSQVASAQVRDLQLQATQQGFNINLATNNNIAILRPIRYTKKERQ